MNKYDWDNKKNEKLIRDRKISFEEIIFNIENGNLLNDLDHPNQTIYQHQRMLIVKVRDYVYLVPYVKNKDIFSLITIIPNRKATKKYLKNGE